MKQLMSMPLSRTWTPQTWPDLSAACAAARCDGLEMMWAGDEMPDNVPEALRVGYHLAFFPDWLDFWREDRPALLKKFGSQEAWRSFYGGDGHDHLLDYYRRDLDRAAALDAKYLVFHVTDISIEEEFTWHWLHTDEEIIDAAADLLNQVLAGREPSPLLLVENQWWPGFRFNDPRLTARLLDAIDYPRKGIMLDIGHLMNNCSAIRTEREGADYVESMLDLHGDLCRYIRGVHLHQSLSGPYVEQLRRSPMPELPEDYLARYSAACRNVYEIDQHQPWHDPAVQRLLRRIHPDFVVHELRNKGPEDLLRRIRTQQTAMGL